MSENNAKGHVFIVDDDKGLLRLIGKALTREGLSIASATSGKEASAWLAGNRTDLMLLDLKLPDMEGDELIRHLAERDRSVPFIIITGQGDERVAVEMMKRGAADYVVKDIHFLDLIFPVVRRTLSQLDREKKLQSAEEALRREHAFSAAVLDTSSALMVVLDREGRIVRFNRACRRITGYSLEEVKGKLFGDLFIIPEEQQEVRAVFDSLLAGNFPSQFENYWRTKAGLLRLIAWSNNVLFDDRGMVEYVISIGIDITERKRLEKEILEISDREQRRFGQDLHDGLGQHLAAIELMSRALEQQLSARSIPEAKRVGEIASYVREAVGQTRGLARGLSPVELEANGLMSALQELALNTDRMFNVETLFRCEKSVLLEDNGVGTHLFRIAQEAVNNAVKHSRAERIEISLAAGRGGLILSVQDNGVGFDLRKTQSPGMGLRTMQYRAGMIGGKLEVQSNPGEGTEVVCTVSRAGEKGLYYVPDHEI